MEVILKENIDKLGKAGDVVKVKDGYARNFLLPGNKAAKVNEKNLKTIQEEFRRRREKIKQNDEKMREAADKLKGTEVAIKKLASEDDKLFGSVAEADIAAELKKQGVDVEKQDIILDKHIKELGVFKVPVRFREGIEAEVKVWVVRDNEKKEG